MKEFIIRENLFKTETLFIVDCTQEQATKLLKSKYKTEVNHLDDRTTGTVIKSTDENYFRIVYIKEWKIKDFGEIMHELFHLVVRICEDKGVSVVANLENGYCGDETAAYLLEFYVNDILKKIK